MFPDVTATDVVFWLGVLGLTVISPWDVVGGMWIGALLTILWGMRCQWVIAKRKEKQ